MNKIAILKKKRGITRFSISFFFFLFDTELLSCCEANHFHHSKTASLRFDENYNRYLPEILASNAARDVETGGPVSKVAKRATDSTTGGDQAHDARQDLSPLDTILNVTDIRRKQLKTITLIVRAEQLTRIGSEKKTVSPRSNCSFPFPCDPPVEHLPLFTRTGREGGHSRLPSCRLDALQAHRIAGEIAIENSHWNHHHRPEIP